MERAEVFEATHRLLLRLIAEGKVQGVRLDHIDGLYDPRGYCERLLSRVAEVLPTAGTATAPRSTRAAAGRSTAGREDPRPPRVSARGPAGRRHHRLRVHQPRGRPVRRSRRRAPADRDLSPLHRPGARVRPGGARGQAADPALLAQQRAARARARAPPARAAELADPRLHADRPARGARRRHRALPGLPHLHHRGRRQAGGPARSRLGGQPARRETALVDHTVFDFLHAALSTDLAARAATGAPTSSPPRCTSSS